MGIKRIVSLCPYLSRGVYQQVLCCKLFGPGTGLEVYRLPSQPYKLKLLLHFKGRVSVTIAGSFPD